MGEKRRQCGLRARDSGGGAGEQQYVAGHDGVEEGRKGGRERGNKEVAVLFVVWVGEYGCVSVRMCACFEGRVCAYGVR